MEQGNIEQYEYLYLYIDNFNFDDPVNWTELKNKDFLCDLCFKNSAEFSTLQFATWEGGKIGASGGGDIYIDYCSDCRKKKKKFRRSENYKGDDWFS